MTTHAPFVRSAEYYDAMYDAKEYDDEARRYALAFGDAPKSVLEFGAGTGNFTRRWRDMGYDVVGVEPCDEMRAVAERKGVDVISGQLGSIYPVSNFLESPKHDVVACPFGVFCYATARFTPQYCVSEVSRYLKPGGKFVLDVFNSLAVAASIKRHDTRIRSCGDVVIQRCSKKTFDAETSLLTHEMHFDVLDKNGNGNRAWDETHVVRCFSPSEIKYALEQNGFTVTGMWDWGGVTESSVKPSISSWYVFVEAAK